MNKFDLIKELEMVERKLYSSLGSSEYFVSDGYVKKFNDSLSDAFIDIKIIREATKEEEYLYEKRWQLKDMLKKY